jgi:hypothetical protein
MEKMKKAIIGIGVFVLIIGSLLVALPSVYVSKTTSEAYQIPKSTVIIGSQWMPPIAFPTTDMAKGASLTAGDSLNIQVNATSDKDINFYVDSGSPGLVYPYGETQLAYSNVTALNKDWIVPINSSYAFAFNSTSQFTYSDVTMLVTKQWNETAYRDVTQNVRVIPFQVVYVGLVITLSGVAITTYGIITPKKQRSG